MKKIITTLIIATVSLNVFAQQIISSNFSGQNAWMPASHPGNSNLGGKLHLHWDDIKNTVGSHYGIRLEDVFYGPVPPPPGPGQIIGNQAIGTSTWDIEPIADLLGSSSLLRFKSSQTIPLTMMVDGKVNFNAIVSGNPHRMTILPNGNIGINSNNPQAKLHITQNAGALNLEGTNHVYMQFYPNGYSEGRKGWIGFGSGTNTDLTINNQHTDGRINLVSTKVHIDGNVGIGVISPLEKLDVRGTGRFGTTAGYINVGFNTANAIIDNFGTGSLLINYYSNKDVVIGNGAVSTPSNLKVNGNVGIGTNPNSNYRMSVNGAIRAKEVIVETGWSDFVFDDNYKLPTLNERRTFIEKYGHLPNMISEKEVLKNGANVGKALNGILQNVEEHELYIQIMNERFEKLEKENEWLKEYILLLNEKITK